MHLRGLNSDGTIKLFCFHSRKIEGLDKLTKHWKTKDKTKMARQKKLKNKKKETINKLINNFFCLLQTPHKKFFNKIRIFFYSDCEKK